MSYDFAGRFGWANWDEYQAGCSYVFCFHIVDKGKHQTKGARVCVSLMYFVLSCGRDVRWRRSRKLGIKSDVQWEGMPRRCAGRQDGRPMRNSGACRRPRRPCFKSDSRGGGDAVFQVGFTRRPAKEKNKLKKRERNLNVLCLIAPCRTEFE